MRIDHIIPGKKHFGFSLRLILLGGVSLLPMARAAHAASCPPTVSSAVTGAVTLNGDCTIASTGVIAGGNIGVLNNGHDIGALLNAGSVSGSSDGVINSSGSIASLTNSGTISGETGIDNGGVANNQGGHPIVNVISPPMAPASIGVLTNTGHINGAGTGILNLGAIGALGNSGTITGGFGAGINNAGSIGAIDNTGLIQGATGVFLSAAGSTLTNSGTIISTDGGNAIDFGTLGGNLLTLTTGSEIIGTIDGGGTKNQITLDGTGTLNNTIADFAPGSALNVVPGADWTGYGNWQIATVTNDGVFQPGILGTPLNLTGNFVQNPDGTLRVLVNPSNSPFATTRFNIGGAAQLAGGVKYYFAPGTYSAGTISVLTAAGGVTGGFSSVTYNGASAALGHETLITAASVDLRLTGIVAPLDDSIASDEIQSSAAQAQSGNAALLDKASEGEAAGAGPKTCAPEAAVTPGQVSGVAKMTNAVAGAICGAGGWIQATGTAMRADGDASVPSYDADTAGFLAGIDRKVNNEGLRLGLAAGYDEIFLRNGAGSKGQVETTRFGLFGSQTLGRFTLAGDFMAGISNITTNRVTGVGPAHATNGGDSFAGGLQIETLVQETYFDLVPRAGIRIAAVSAGGFDETGGNAAEPFSLTGETSGYVSVQPFVNLSLSHRFVTESGIAITPEASLGYVYEAGARGRAVTLNARDGTKFSSSDVSLAGSAGQAAFSLSASQGMWSLYASYGADVAANWVSQTGEAGLRLRF
jgi:uncharacterized protein with beta-barrel porin domain